MSGTTPTYADLTALENRLNAKIDALDVRVKKLEQASPNPLESAIGTALTTTTGVIQDATGAKWNLVSSASMGMQIARNAVVDTVTQNVTLLYYASDHRVYQQNSAGNWWSAAWDGVLIVWTPTGDPRVPPATLAESAQGDSIATTTGKIVDAMLLPWTLVLSATMGNQIARVGVVDPVTQNVTLLLYWNHAVYQQNSAGNWWRWGSGSWVVSSDPRVVVPPTTGIPSDPTGVQAVRVVDVLCGYGANCFDNGQDGAGANASVSAHTTGFNYILKDTGLWWTNRLYASNLSQQADFCKRLSAAFPGMAWIITPNLVQDVQTCIDLCKQLKAAGIDVFGEGLNEPNMPLGRAPLSPSQALQVQQTIWAALKGQVPVLGTALGEDGNLNGPGYVQRWWGTLLPALIAACDMWVSHDYPNSGSPNRDMEYRTQGVAAAYQKTKGFITEQDCLLYNKPAVPVSVADERSAYHTLCMILSGFKHHRVTGMQHWPFYDYAGFDPACGLFHGNNPNDPRLVATALRALFRSCADLSQVKRTFTPGKLDISFTGLPTGFNQYSGGQTLVMQTGSGRFKVAVWNDQDALSTARTMVGVKLGVAKRSVIDTSLTMPLVANPAPRQSLNNVTNFTLDLGNEVRVLDITV
jgi:hypothetical protein